MNAIDVLVFLPLIPAIPVIATWFLPWETWIPRRVPKSIIGPYLIYCSFGIWYFKRDRWFTLGVAAFGVVVSVLAVFDARKAGQLKEASGWPVAEGQVLSTSQGRGLDGRPSVTLSYSYKVRGERHGGIQSFTLADDEAAAQFEEVCSGRALRVRYREDKPDVSVVLREEMP
ncbi:MAG TPA: DUF3592 domain-containing protein [Terriglobales bacterium]